MARMLETPIKRPYRLRGASNIAQLLHPIGYRILRSIKRTPKDLFGPAI